ncbi:MAG: DUF1570 domain-containing protein [Planctomycetota bacterium]
MRALWIAAVLLALGVQAYALDVLHMKDGRDVKGVILKESEKEILLRTIIFGKAGEIDGFASADFPKAEIKRVERMSAVERAKLIARSEAFSKRGIHLLEAMRKIEPKRVRFMGQVGLRTKGRRFEITSSCDREFVCAITHYLEEMFAAYEQDFEIKVGATDRIKVYVLRNLDEYKRFQIIESGQAVENPAYYNFADNYIVAYNMVPEDKAAEARKEIMAAIRTIEKEKDKLEKFKIDAHKQAREYHKDLTRQEAAARKRIQAAGGPNKNKRLKDLADRVKLERRRIRNWVKKQRERYREVEDEANEVIRQNRQAILHNNGIVQRMNQAMFETLFHEGFHAFARNFLWTGRKAMAMNRWINEGLAVYFEGSVVEAGYLIHGGARAHQLKTLRKAKNEGRLVPIPDLLVADHLKFMVLPGQKGDVSALHYAQSWLLVHYMTDRVPRRAMQTYVHQVAAGMPAKRAFELMTGMNCKRVEAEVRAHLALLK